MTTTVLNTKIGEFENKIPDHAEYITSQEFNKLTAENFAARSKQANLVSKTDFDNTLISFNGKITSSKTKYLAVQKLKKKQKKQNKTKQKTKQKKLNSLTTKGYIFFLGGIFFRSNDGSQKMLNT